MGRRDLALTWSQRACNATNSLGNLALIWQQMHHFEKDPFPHRKEAFIKN